MRYRAHGYMYINSIDFLQEAFEFIGILALTLMTGGTLASATLQELAALLSQIAVHSTMANRLINVINRLLQNIHQIEYVDTDDIRISLHGDMALRGTELIQYMRIEYESNNWHPWALVYWLYQFAETTEEVEAVSQFGTLLLFTTLYTSEGATLRLNASMPFNEWFSLLLHHRDVKKAGANRCYELSFNNPATYKAIEIALPKIAQNFLTYTLGQITNIQIHENSITINPIHIYRIPYFRHGYKCKLRIRAQGEWNGSMDIYIPSYNEQELYYAFFYLSNMANMLIQKHQTIAEEYGYKRLKLYEELQAFSRIEFSDMRIVDSTPGFEFSDNEDDNGGDNPPTKPKPKEDKWAIALLSLLMLAMVSN